MSKLLERLDKLEKAAQSVPEDYDDERCDTAENFNFVYAVAAAYPKLRAVVEAAEKLSETCRDILPGGSAEAIGDFYGDTYELADALAALEEDV